MMGHYSVSFTFDKYSHLFPERRHEAHDRIDELLRESDAAAAAGGGDVIPFAKD